MTTIIVMMPITIKINMLKCGNNDESRRMLGVILMSKQMIMWKICN